MILIRACKVYFLLGIICNFLIGNEYIYFGPFNIALFFHWATIFAASVIVFTSFRNQKLALLLILSIFISRILEFGSPAFAPVYYILVGLLFLFTGAILFTHNPDLIYKQVMIISIVNIIFMVMQLNGVGSWVFIGTSYPVPTTLDKPLFVSASDLALSSVQLRPPGIMSSATWQSLFTFLAMILHLSRTKRRFPCGTLIVVLLVVISMSKMPIIGLVFISIILFVKGGSSQKLFIAKALLAYLIILGLFSKLYPGVFYNTMIPTYWAFSFFARLNRLLYTIYGDQVPLFLERFTEGTQHAYWHPKDELLSGYTAIYYYRSIIIYFIPFFAIILIWLRNKYKKLNSLSPEYAAFTLVCLFTVFLYPGLFNIFSNPLYWFIGGGAFLPIILIQKKPFFRIPSNHLI